MAIAHDSAAIVARAAQKEPAFKMSSQCVVIEDDDEAPAPAGRQWAPSAELPAGWAVQRGAFPGGQPFTKYKNPEGKIFRSWATAHLQECSWSFDPSRAGLPGTVVSHCTRVQGSGWRGPPGSRILASSPVRWRQRRHGGSTYMGAPPTAPRHLPSPCQPLWLRPRRHRRTPRQRHCPR